MGFVLHSTDQETELHEQADAAGCQNLSVVSDDFNVDEMLGRTYGQRCLLVLGKDARDHFRTTIGGLVYHGRGNLTGFLVAKLDGSFEINRNYTRQHGIQVFEWDDREQALAWAADAVTKA